MNINNRITLIVLSGFLNLLLSFILPMAGGGASMILLLTVPFCIVLALAFGLIYYFMFRKAGTTKEKTIVFNVMIAILIAVSFIFFPYK